MTDANTDGAFDDPDRALPTEDDNPESLAGDPVEFNPDAPEPTGDNPEPTGDETPEPPADSGQAAESA